MWSSLDGRGSETQLMLFAELRRMHRRGDVLAVKAFVPAQKAAAAAPAANPEDEYNASMASQLLAVGRHYPNATIAVLVGNAHAAKAPIPGMDPPFVPAAGKLPAAEVLSLDVWGEGGQGWTCAQSGCGPHPAPEHPAHPRALVLGDGDMGLFDGVVYLGHPLEASPPANLLAR